MGKVYGSVTISADGFMAGLHQTRERPFGDSPADELHRWAFETPEENMDERSAVVDAGAFIMGRHMFGPSRGEWDLTWRGWWGDDPPYHGPVFVLTHHPREPLTMEGGTTFTFVAEGIEAALARARAVASDRDISIAGGAATINQYLRARGRPGAAVGDIEYDLARVQWTRVDEMPDDLAIVAVFETAVREAGIGRDRACDWVVFRTVDYWLWGLAHGLSEDPACCHRTATAFVG